jgi:hypothetical protein
MAGISTHGILYPSLSGEPHGVESHRCLVHYVQDRNPSSPRLRGYLRATGAPCLVGLRQILGKLRSPTSLEEGIIRQSLFVASQDGLHHGLVSYCYHLRRAIAMADRAAKRMRRLSTEYEESEGADEWTKGNNSM